MGGTEGSAEDINQAGHVVGHSKIDSASYPYRAFFWSDRNGNGQSDPGEMVSLGTPGGFDQSLANALNSADVVVGTLLPFSDNLNRAFSWSNANGNRASDPGEMALLAMLSDGVASDAFDINAGGQTVGQTRAANFTFRATLWSSTQAFDLNSLLDLSPGQTIPTLEYAMAINDAGQILAQGNVATGLGKKSSVYLLTPVPEPSGAALAAIGFGGIVLWWMCRLLVSRAVPVGVRTEPRC